MSEKKQRTVPTEYEETERVDEGSDQQTVEGSAPGSTEEQRADLERRLEAKEQEIRETVDKLLRVSADFENYKKRSAREIEEFRKYANQALLKEMLSALDHIELAIRAASDKGAPGSNIGEGLNLTLKELQRIFKKFDVKAIEAEGMPFNPEFHEAMLREESETMPENTVLREMQKGYMIGKRLLRPALVVVSAAPAVPS
ncbi:MAG: nucleotide exchange factor GrpE [Desulfobacterales bacterium]